MWSFCGHLTKKAMENPITLGFSIAFNYMIRLNIFSISYMEYEMMIGLP